MNLFVETRAAPYSPTNFSLSRGANKLKFVGHLKKQKRRLRLLAATLLFCP